MSQAQYLDPRTGNRYSLDEPRWRSDAGGPLLVEALPGIGKDDIDSKTRSLWRYRASLPLDIKPVTLGEGCTPLLEKSWGKEQLLFKADWISPTGSFKDKGATVMVSFLKQLGIDAILEDSSGNGGAAISAYGVAAGMRVRILCPESTQPAKVAQMRIFGADVRLIPGTRQDTENAALQQASEVFYASHNWHPFFLQGTKMTAYEIWEDLGFRAPDNVILPVGAGSNVMGCDLGFCELLAAGQIKKLPRIFGVQPAACAPIKASFDAGSFDLVPTEFSTTMAEGASIRKPVRLKEVLSAVHRSAGAMVTVREDEILAALHRLAGMGLFVEPTSAIVGAAIDQLYASGKIRSGETTVALLSGSGLKASAFVTKLFEG
ncbi:threonine synthase [Steroidobacter sp.]|uniref:threonine synthase n=1 Tax=Steroidobacter sp. TaxID=1978227 RepID=UPI001A556909|nr:threonine synthase [Steroidobacter sp.]MBL8266892.1 threonine synthase [Steroidobacter sp.]